MTVTFDNEQEFMDFIASFSGDFFYKAAFRMDGSCELLDFENFCYEDIEDYPVTVEFRRDMMQINAVRAMGKVYLCTDFQDVGRKALDVRDEMISKGLSGVVEALSRVICLTDWYDEYRRFKDLFNKDLSDMVKDSYKRLLAQDGYNKVLFRINT